MELGVYLTFSVLALNPSPLPPVWKKGLGDKGKCAKLRCTHGVSIVTPFRLPKNWMEGIKGNTEVMFYWSQFNSLLPQIHPNQTLTIFLV